MKSLIRISKKGDAGVIIMVAIALIGFTIMLLYVYQPWREAIKEKVDTQGCDIQLIVQSLARKVSFGVEDATAKCEMKKVHVTKEVLDKYSTLADEAKKNQKYTESKEVWELKRLIADKMVECSDKGWHGKWDVRGQSLVQIALGSTGGVLCVICARITFADEVKYIIPIEKTIHMDGWLRKNNVEGKSYYEYITQGNDEYFKQNVQMSIFDTGEDLAIIFLTYTTKEFGSLSTSSTGGVGIYNYNNLLTDLGFNISGTVTEETAKCTEIIGIV